MQVPLEGHDAGGRHDHLARSRRPARCSRRPVTGGHCKLQWKPDWAMRWHALGVDYEMAGKDLIDSVKLSGRIVRALGSEPPEGFNYELFLDEKGQKISKSKGNGLTIDEWLTYASPESLSVFMFGKPTAAKKLYFDVIPRAVDDYLTLSRRLSAAGLEGTARQSGVAPPCRRAAGPGAAGARGRAPARRCPSPCCSTSRPWPTARTRPCSGPSCSAMRRACRPTPIRGSTGSSAMRCATSATSCGRRNATARPTTSSAARLQRLVTHAGRLPPDASAEDIQTALYDIARPIPRYQDFKAKTATPERPGVSNDWFNMLYQVLLGEERGPRFGSFVALYGIPETRALIAKALDGGLIAEHEAFLAERADLEPVS